MRTRKRDVTVMRKGNDIWEIGVEIRMGRKQGKGGV